MVSKITFEFAQDPNLILNLILWLLLLKSANHSVPVVVLLSHPLNAKHLEISPDNARH